MGRPYGGVIWGLAALFLMASVVQAKPKPLERIEAATTLEAWGKVEAELREQIPTLPMEERRELRRSLRDKRRALRRAEMEQRKRERPHAP